MKSLSIHNLDDQLADLIAARAKEEGISMNRVVKRLLAEAVGVRPPDESVHREEFEQFCGAWNDEDLASFRRHTEAFDRVDEGDWQ